MESYIRGPREFTVAGLNAWIERAFQVHIGPMRSWYGWDADRCVALNQDSEKNLRGIYKVIGVGLDAARKIEFFAGEPIVRAGEVRRLVEPMYLTLDRLHTRAACLTPGEMPHMVIRRKLTLSAEDRRAILSIRFDLPALPQGTFGFELLEKPEGYQYKFVTEDGDVIDAPAEAFLPLEQGF